jgi:hypothetical protein
MPAQPSPSPERNDKRRHPEAGNRARAAAPNERGELNAEQVARRAYERFEARGGEHGHDQEDWFHAEQELRGTRGE